LRLAEPERFDAVARARLHQVFDLEEAPCSTSDLPKIFAEVDALWFRLGHRIDERVLPAGTRCRAIATPVTGLDHIDLDWCKKVGVRVVSLRGETEFLREVRATAEHTLGLTLALLRHIPAAHAHAQTGRWRRDQFPGREIYRKTVGIVGVGRLGSIVADYFRALGAQLLGYDPNASLPDFVERVDDLALLFTKSDIVSIHAALTPETHHLIDARILKHARPQTVLINTARGSIVDTEALLVALREGRLGGAALDVLEGEPTFDPDHPVFAYARAHDNLLITPHIAGNTEESFAKTERFLAERLIEVFRA
jgi:D-3-phosphoglycerate dehydrogenase